MVPHVYIYSYNLNLSATDTRASSKYISTDIHVSIFRLVSGKNPLLPVFYPGKIQNVKCKDFKYAIIECVKWADSGV